MIRTVTPQTLAVVAGGLATGYIVWLLGISSGDNAAVGQWGPPVLLGSVVLALCAGAWGWRQRRRGNRLRAAFAFALPILPVVLTLAILADVYL